MTVQEPTDVATETVIICASDLPYTWGTHGIVTEAGTHYDTVRSVLGCDSLRHTLVLTVQEPTDVATENITICASDLPYTWGAHGIVTESGTHYDTVRSILGCDSLRYTLVLTVQEPTMAPEETVSVCESELPYNWLDHYMVDTAGTYYDTARYATGCDSVYYTLHLMVNKPTTIDTTVIICEGQSFTLGDTTLTTAGNYTRTIPSLVTNCDSTIHLTLTVTSADVTPLTATICEGGSYPLGNKLLTKAGIYRDTTYTMEGCMAITELTLSVTPAGVDYISDTFCEGSTYNFHGTPLSVAGTYRDTTYAADGCMSITELTLTSRTCRGRAETYVTSFVCPGTEYHGRLTSHIITEAVSWLDSVRVDVDGLPTDSLYHYSITPYVTTLPAISADDVWAICGQAINVDEATGKINEHIAAEPYYAPDPVIAWEVQTNGVWQPFNTTVAIEGGVEQLTLRLTVTTECGVETTAPIMVQVETPAPENTASMDNVPAAGKYSDYLLMIDKRAIEDTYGWTLQPADVHWYRVVGSIDNYADGSTRDDEQVGEGFYYTVGAQLTGSFYARITHTPTTAADCAGELRTVELICSAAKAAPSLAPTVARPAEQIRVLNLDPERTTEIRVYSVSGELLETYTSQEAVEFLLRAAGTAGYYMVDVQTDDEKVTLQYIVK